MSQPLISGKGCWGGGGGIWWAIGCVFFGCPCINHVLSLRVCVICVFVHWDVGHT